MLSNRNQKNHSRFHIVYDKYHYLVQNIAKGYLDHEEALDVCQETFLALYLHYDLSLSDEELKALLIRLTSNKSIDYYRKRVCDTKSSATWCYERQTICDNCNALESEIIKKEFYYKVIKDVENMKPEWADILIFHGILGMTQDETAKRMNIPITALRSRLNRARNYLKTIYDDDIKLLL